MGERLLADVQEDGSIRITATPMTGGPGASQWESADSAWTINDDELEQLRWYLEDYLTTPFGVYGDSGSVYPPP
ncbi:hypothetical protein ACQPYH_28290 [Kribbella sp. CA-245084]|uniref:hypothetical protein n=1 Tax=Kribbella sp. CA-245084 TaxID=3239940 RepID=UPI003D902BC3